MNDALLEVEGLGVEISDRRGVVTPVDSVSFTVAEGECLGIVGESGAGKSLALRAVIGLLPPGGRLKGGALRLRQPGGDAPVRYDPVRERGHGITMVFQEPTASLNPTMRVGDFVAEGSRIHRGLSGRAARRRAVELMADVGIPDPSRVADAWPHQLSGGMCQRVMIAAALATEPRLLLCDEPTTALDVTVQDQILGLLDRIRRERRLSVVFVSHDLAVIAQIADRIAVMYAGQVIETGAAEEILSSPRHPYSWGLISAIPDVGHAYRQRGERLSSIPGSPPDPRRSAPGCRFAPRCPHSEAVCSTAGALPLAAMSDRATACVRSAELYEAVRR
jgi:oligopeptide/dipeptide ABC transporter ATP-binding protein